MNKKTITSLAILISAQSVHAMPPPRDPNAPPIKFTERTMCLSQEELAADKSVNIGSCDMASINKEIGRSLKKNGCAEAQYAIKVYDRQDGEGEAAVKTVGLTLPMCSMAVQL